MIFVWLSACSYIFKEFVYLTRYPVPTTGSSRSQMSSFDSNFPCKYTNCIYQTKDFNRFLNHVWDKHSIEARFFFKCGISGCINVFRNQKSFRRHCQKKHFWFFERNMKKRNKNLEVNETFVEKVPSDEVGLHVGGPNFDADMKQWRRKEKDSKWFW